jgi:NAD(P)-dependent dehydrogenase (short-subunit alcohol dehydrogenase family)
MGMEGRPVVVVGLARSGIAAARFLARRGNAVVATDRKTPAELPEEALTLEGAGVRLELGGHRPETLAGASLVVVSPGVPWQAPDLAAARAAGAGRVWHFVTHQAVYEAVRYPRAAVDYIEQQRLPGPIYNQYGWGGYLIKRLYPEYRVYIDGRADVYGDAFMTEAIRTYDGRTGWREPLDRLAVTTVLVAPDAPIASLLRDDSEWKKVYEDRQAVIFTKDAVQTADTVTTPPILGAISRQTK